MLTFGLPARWGTLPDREHRPRLGVRVLHGSSGRFNYSTLDLLPFIRPKPQRERPKLLPVLLRGCGAPLGEPSSVRTDPKRGQHRLLFSKGCFADSLRRGQFVAVTIDHDADRIIADTTTGGVLLWQTNEALEFACSLPDTPNAREVVRRVWAGTITGASVGVDLGSAETTWQQTGGVPLLVVHRGGLDEVALTDKPSFPKTTVAVISTPDPVVALIRQRVWLAGQGESVITWRKRSA
jgi:HK97 family phage prohead protease